VLQFEISCDLRVLWQTKHDRRGILFGWPQLAAQAFQNEITVFGVGRRHLGKHIILPESLLQGNHFRFVGHVPVNMPDDDFIRIVAV